MSAGSSRHPCVGQGTVEGRIIQLDWNENPFNLVRILPILSYKNSSK